MQPAIPMRYGERANPFDIRLPPEDRKVIRPVKAHQDVSPAFHTVLFRVLVNILQDARLRYTIIVPGQYPTIW